MAWLACRKITSWHVHSSQPRVRASHEYMIMRTLGKCGYSTSIHQTFLFHQASPLNEESGSFGTYFHSWTCRSTLSVKQHLLMMYISEETSLSQIPSLLYIDCQLSIVNYRLSIVDCWLLIVTCWLSIVDCWLSIVNCRKIRIIRIIRIIRMIMIIIIIMIQRCANNRKRCSTNKVREESVVQTTE
jgi:hypothetical protein